MFYVFSAAKIKQNNDKSAQNRQKNQKSIKKNDFIVTNCYSKRGKGKSKKEEKKKRRDSCRCCGPPFMAACPRRVSAFMAACPHRVLAFRQQSLLPFLF
jgi:hypothetical protein